MVFGVVGGFVRKLAAILMLAGISSNALAQTTPSNLQVLGTITSSGTDKPTLASGNSVYAVNKASGSTEGSGSIVDSTGAYLIDMSKEQSFNGTMLRLRLSNGGKTYKLMAGTEEAEFSYNGGFPFPGKQLMNVSVGDVVNSSGGGSGGGGAGASAGEGDCGGKDSSFDANGDGVSNQADIDFIKAQLGNSTPSTKADINKDGRVTTADVIQAMRTSASAMRGRTACPDKAASPSTNSETSSESE